MPVELHTSPTIPKSAAPGRGRVRRQPLADPGRDGLPGDGAGFDRRPEGAFPYESSPLLVEPGKQAPAAVTRALEIAGLRWNLAIIREIAQGVGRFNRLHESLGISTKMLMRRLHMLLAYGIVERVPSPSRANGFEYRLTASGRELWQITAALGDWGERHLSPEPVARH